MLIYWVCIAFIFIMCMSGSITIKTTTSKKKELTEKDRLLALEKLDRKHLERMAIIDNLQKAELDKALEEVEKEIKALEAQAFKEEEK